MKKIIQKIKKAKNIGLLIHTKPDPDAIGSASAFYFALKQKNKNVDIILEEKLLKNLEFFDIENIVYKIEDGKYDLLISLDCGSKSLLGKFADYFTNFDNTISIDHHRSRDEVGKLEYINSDASSTAEILFSLLSKMKIKITKDIATALYAGLVGDTGRFFHNNTTSKVFNIASSLVKCGADMNLVNNKLFRSDSIEKINLLKIMLENLQIKNGVGISCLTLVDYKRTHCIPSQSYELINTLQAMEDVDIAIILNEIKPNVVNGSLRSKLNFDVSVIAQNFGGGGHKQASGCRNISGSLEEVKTKMLDFIKKHKKEIGIDR